METEIPTWLTKEYVKHALEHDEDNPSGNIITVEDIVVDKPIAKGDNFVCDIYRVSVTYRASIKNNDEPLQTSLIVKAPIVTGLYETLSKIGLHTKEVRVYKEYLPELDSLVGEKHRLTAKSFHSDEKDVLVLEDLKFKGYVMTDRRKQLDYDHCLIALKSLALYHAASVHIHNRVPELVEEIGHEVFFVENNKGTNNEYTKFTFSLMTEASKKTPELSRYSEKFQKLSETSWDMMAEITKPKDNSLNVMNHGDFWVNNMMFRYENEKPVDIKLLDFQVSRYTTPAVDLVYFLYGSVQEEIRDKRTDDLLSFYLNELNANLEKFGVSERLTESELKRMISLIEFFGLFISVSVFPMVVGDPKAFVVELRDMKEEDLQDFKNNPFSAFYRNEKFITVLKKRLIEFEKQGWF